MAAIALLIIVFIIFASMPVRVEPKPRPVSGVPQISLEEQLKQRQKEWLKEMRAKYPMRTDAKGDKTICLDGKNSSITYHVKRGESDISAYHEFERVANLITQERNIYGEF